MTSNEWFVVGAVIAGLFVFEGLPKLLNIIKNKRQAKQNDKAS